MKQFSVYILSVLCLISCIRERPVGSDLAVGDCIPDFTVTMNDGTTVSGVQLSDGVSCIVFFTTACPDCRQTLPHVQRIYDRYLAEGVRFAVISREDGSDSVSEYWSGQGYTMPYSAQTDRSIYELFARTRVPRIYICRYGIIKTIFTDSPIPTYDDLDSAIVSALSKY